MNYYEKSKKRSKKLSRTIGIIFVFVGLFSVLYFFFPIISYQLFIARAYEGEGIEVPVPKYLVANKSNSDGIGSLISQGINSLTTDYSDARNWYPGVSEPQVVHEQIAADQEKPVASYLLSIPKLKIDNAVVSTQDYNLTEHLVQYFGTAIPGNAGTAVIFGHSTLPSWFDPKNYKTIFATLHTLKVGDDFTVTVDNQVYKYKIFSIQITTPEDVNILSQSFDNSYVTIVTCTPPGTIWKRLIVRAALES